MRVRILSFPKREDGRGPNEDAASHNEARCVFVVSDGAGSGSYAHQWAATLVNYASIEPIRSTEPAEVNHWLRGARNRFFERVPPVDIEKLPAELRGTARRGAFATLHQVRFMRDDYGKLLTECISIGDTCTFLWRSSVQGLGNIHEPDAITRIEMHPQKSFVDFDRAPHLLTTSPDMFNAYMHRLERHVFHDLNPGDVVMIATDAVARWLVSQSDVESAKNILLALSETDWGNWIELHRNDHTIGNDDSTLMIVMIDENDISAAPHMDSAIDEQRELELEMALRCEVQDSFVISEAWGDGSAIGQRKRDQFWPEVQHHLGIYKAIQYMRGAIDSFERGVFSLDELRNEWQRWRAVLEDMRVGQGIRRTLEQIGVLAESSEDLP
jgi:hypothetical protein